jgi:hypothetical protein
MRRFGSGLTCRKSRPARRSVASVFMAWIAAVALILSQVPVLAATVVPVLPLLASGSAAPCKAMDSPSVDNTGAVTVLAMPCCDKATPDSQPGDPHPCPPLSGGCFAMCATILPMVAAIKPATQALAQAHFFEVSATPRAVPPPQRPPRSL